LDWLYTLSGFAVGFTVGVTGVGGGSLMTPLLVLAFGVAPATAVGTDLLYAAATKVGGTWVHGRRGTVEWKIVGLLATGSLPAAATSVLLLRQLAFDEARLRAVLTTVLAVALVLTALVLFAKPWLKRYSEAPGGAVEALRGRHLRAATIAAGATLGVLVTLSSVGAGALGAAMLLLLYPRLESARVVGTDIAHAVPLTLIAGLGHAALGTVSYAILGSLLLGSLPGIYLGSHLGVKLPERVLRPVLATMLMAVGGRLLFA
jgi:uncharacterized membrane protein YfcA